MINNIVLTGRLVRDIETRAIASTGTSVGTFTLANETGFGDKKRTNFIRCTAFGKTAESMEKYTSKGSLIGVVGELQHDTYEKDGQKRESVTVIARSVEFINTGNAPKSDEMPSGFAKMDDDSDLPF